MECGGDTVAAENIDSAETSPKKAKVQVINNCFLSVSFIFFL